MTPVDPPARLDPPPPGLGRLGDALHWLAQAQGSWPPHPPHLRRIVEICPSGLEGGRAEADALADAGVDLLVLDGPPSSAAALTVLCALLDLEPVLAVGTAAEPGWAALVVGVRDALPLARSLVGDPERLVADPLVGHATGLLVQCAVRRTPVVLGTSPVIAAAVLAAERIAPGARRWWLAGNASPATAVRLAYADLALDPLLDLGVTVAGGAVLAADLLVNAIALLPGG